MDQRKNIALVPLSGGIDSAACAAYACGRHSAVVPVYVDMGSANAAKERQASLDVCKHLGLGHNIVQLPMNPEHPLMNGINIPLADSEPEEIDRIILENRNLCVVLATLMYGVSHHLGHSLELYFGTTRWDAESCFDCSTEFFTRLQSNLQSLVPMPVKFTTPFIDMSKAMIIKYGAKHLDLSKTWSCYMSREKHCGKCSACVERIDAFWRANITDFTEYEDSRYGRQLAETNWKGRYVD